MYVQKKRAQPYHQHTEDYESDDENDDELVFDDTEYSSILEKNEEYQRFLSSAASGHEYEFQDCFSDDLDPEFDDVLSSSPIRWSPEPENVPDLQPEPEKTPQEQSEPEFVPVLQPEPEKSVHNIPCDQVQNLGAALKTVHDHFPLLRISESDLKSPDPADIQCDKVQNLDSALEKVHENFPHLQPVQKGRVYQMDKILDSIAESEKPSYTLRKKERHDYKKLHSKGKNWEER